MQGHPRQTGHSEEFWQNLVYWKRKWKHTPVFLHGQYEKAKRYETGKWVWVWRYPIWYTGSACSVTHLYPSLSNPMDCSPPDSSVNGIFPGKIFQVRMLESVNISSYRRSSWPWGWTKVSWISCIDRQMHYHWVSEKLLMALERMKWLGQSRNYVQLWMYLVVIVKSSAVKNDIV